jgi:hypothetical protein
MVNNDWAPRLQARCAPPAIGMPIETPVKLPAFAGTMRSELLVDWVPAFAGMT